MEGMKGKSDENYLQKGKRRRLSLRLPMGKVGNVRMQTRYCLLLFIYCGLSSVLGGCSPRSPRSSALVQAENVQQSSAQAVSDQQKEEPVSLETFSAFLDRG